MHTFIVTSVVPASASEGGRPVAAAGQAALVAQLAELLRPRAIEWAGSPARLTVLHASPEPWPADPLWLANLAAAGIGFMQVNDPIPLVQRWPDLPALRVSEAVAARVRWADIVYFLVPGSPGFHSLRTRRFSPARYPVCVSVLLNSGDLRAGAGEDESVFEALALEFMERYAARHSDFVAAAGAPALEWARRRGWQLPAGRTRVLSSLQDPASGYPAQPDRPPETQPAAVSEFQAARSRWHDLHRELCAFAALRSQREATSAAPPPASYPRGVDVCVPYYNHGRYLPQLLHSLELQTCQDFAVIVVDDGSTDPDAQAVFDAMRERYTARGWTFVRQANAHAGAARNTAVAHGTATYICFIDADDLAAPTMVERFREAIELCGDDCVVAPAYSYRSAQLAAGPPWDARTGAISAAPYMIYYPLGNWPTGGMASDVLGANILIIKRVVFEALGGFTTDLGLGAEDYELHARLTLAGYALDVLPECLQFYRTLPGSLMDTANIYLHDGRGIRPYEARLRTARLGGLATAYQGMFATTNGTDAPGPRLPQNGKRLRLLLLLPYLPYPANSGSRIRRWEMIKYFGSRHSLTVFSFFAPEDDLGAAYEALDPYCAQLTCVPIHYGETQLDSTLPGLVHALSTPAMARALSGMETWRYDAAIVDSIFMCGYLDWLPTLRVLSEHNIESDLLRQTAAWSNAVTLADAAALARYENATWPRFALREVVSARDQRAMDARCKSGRSVVVENGAALEAFQPAISPRSRTVLFMGTLEYFPNQDAVFWFVREIWPLLRRAEPELRFWVAGRNPPPDVKALKADRRITVHADPARMDQVARQCGISVVPLRIGGGTRIKILDAMALGLPVVTTSIGCQGLEVQDGVHLLIRDDPAGFAAAVLHLSRDPDLWMQLRDKALDYVRTRHDWERIYAGLETELVAMLEQERR